MEKLLAELNELRKNRKIISNFTTVEDWIAYNVIYAENHASIIKSIENLSK